MPSAVPQDRLRELQFGSVHAPEALAPSPEAAVLGAFLGLAGYDKSVWKALVKRRIF